MARPDPPDDLADLPPARGVFCNRTLNLRGVRAIGYDMDYTLVHYDEEEWERVAFEHARQLLADGGWPVDDLTFDPQAFTLGLTFDLDLGNLVKATRFGYAVRAQHGTAMLSFDELRTTYYGEVVELADDRYEFMNTLFELSRASLWCQLVAVHDRHPLPGITSYAHLYRAIDAALGTVHRNGSLKAAILADPGRFVDPDPHLVATLQDQRMAGKQLLLVTNSEWDYTQQILGWSVDPLMPAGSTWRELFDVVIVAADKPRFFAETAPAFRIVDERRGLLEPHLGPLEPGPVYHGGNARMVETSLGHDPSQFLYVGDHLFGDVHVTKDVLRWRTALIARELEAEVEAAAGFAATADTLATRMAEKVRREQTHSRLRMARRRSIVADEPHEDLDAAVDAAAAAVAELDEEIAPLARSATEQGNPVWGPLMRAGVDKSLFARQVEKYADVYTSRVSNFRSETPYGFLRAARGSLPHDDAG